MKDAAAMSESGKGKKLLLHVCCGPCAITSAQWLLEQGYAVTAWFMNPNIHPLSEYLRRREAAGQCAQKLGIEIVYADAAWDLGSWLERQLPCRKEPDRCHWCCASRLQAAYEMAVKNGYDCFSTSLLYSRYQPHEYIRDVGFELSRGGGCEFVYHDFRKFWQKGIDLSLEWGLYRQAWCGCIFSEAERYGKKLARLIARQGENLVPAGQENGGQK